MNPHYELVMENICGIGLSFQLDGFRILYAVIATFMWIKAVAFSKEYMSHYENKVRYYIFTILTYVATIGVFLSADLFTLFLFFEIMSLTSYVWVAQDEKKESLRAGDTYLAIAIMGGMVLLMGLFLLYSVTGTLKMNEILTVMKGFDSADAKMNLYAAGGCMLVGFGAKAGAFPLHIWLPKAHPVAPAPASALLSGVLTKAGIYGGIILSCYIFLGDVKWGTLILIVGTITMFWGALLALFSLDLKRTLACSSVSQIGFILVGLGMTGLLGAGHDIAARGTLLHMVNHSMIKLTLFMAAGVVFMNLHELNLNEIRGFGRKKPLLCFVFLLGALSIMGVPFFSGYISKTLLHESIVEYIHLLQTGEVTMFYMLQNNETAIFYSKVVMKMVEWIFLFSGGMTAAYMAKLLIALFVEKNTNKELQRSYDNRNKYMTPLSAAALTLSSLFMLIAGVFPYQIMDKIADIAQPFFNVEVSGHNVSYFSFTNMKGALISLAIGTILYLIMIRKIMMKNGKYIDRWPKWMDLENFFYRPLLLKILPFISGVFCRVLDSIVDVIVVFLRKTLYQDSELKREPEEGNEITHKVGGMIDRLIRYLNRTVWGYHPHEDNVEHKMAMRYQHFSESNTIIARSMSFGLLLACVGLALVLLYLLL